MRSAIGQHAEFYSHRHHRTDTSRYARTTFAHTNDERKIPRQLHAKEFQYVAVCEIVLCNVFARSIEKFIRYYFQLLFLIWMFALVPKVY